MHFLKALLIWLLSVMVRHGISSPLQQITTATMGTRFRRESEPQWHVEFNPKNMTAHMDTLEKVEVTITNIAVENLNYISFRFKSDNNDLARVDDIVMGTQVDRLKRSWHGNITIDVIFLGSTRINVEMSNSLDNTTELSKESFDLIIIRKQRVIDHVFTGSVILLVSLLYINFGAALDLHVLKGLITRPVSPGIGIICQYAFMPLLSFAVGYFIFPDNLEMQLGLFFTGVSPSGGASNIWTVILGGNINLSVLLTTITNLAAFAMMPLWIFTLGHVIFTRGNLKVPYAKIATYSIGLIVPLAIGLAIQKWAPRVSRILVRLLKPISTCLIVFIIVFAIATNVYLFKLFSWQIILAGLLLPWLGYIISWCVAKTFKQNSTDALTIAIETGIQNTGIAIFLLKTLPQPQADLTIVIPVAVDIMTMFPLVGLYIYNKCTGRNIKDGVLTEDQQNIRP
ncbi:P3 protein-like [Lucilia sericata]|uniref:P3 protein-like n=1 Tax=Lucilia sericata TaxID=13632 RepID=UPI0018A81C09|nr:P3 protein-like [Lucilia sericata]XP_037826597.1 P3 protein-like [Lucilia sericata]